MSLGRRIAAGVIFTLVMLAMLGALGAFVAGLELLLWLALLAGGWVLILRWRRAAA